MPIPRVADAGALIRLHESLLFQRAFPSSPGAIRQADRQLFSFARRIDRLRDTHVDLSPFEDPAVSGIAGTSLSAVFSYEVARQLFARYPRNLAIDWENYERQDKLGPVLRRLLPLVEEDWPVEAHVPFRDWIGAAKGQASELGWLLDGIAALPLDARGRSDLYDSLDLLLVWQIENAPASRSLLRLPLPKPYCHRKPLLRRADVSIERELAGPPLRLTRLSRPEAQKILGIILDSSAMRYRELYGFTHPDAARVIRADAGRGVQIFFFGVPPEWRLPLRAYHAGMFFKNGVPIGYVEVLSLFERAEVGFNLYYTFREGETAWVYARLLRLFRQVLGVTCFSVDPYQIGLENDEALDSGAFWFYRKLGFRPLDPAVAQLVGREERKMLRKPGYRSSRHTLEKLARSYILLESSACVPGVWDRFRVRNLALAVERARIADEPNPLRQLLRLAKDREPALDHLEAIVAAKQGPDEVRYLHLLQRHARLRAAVLQLGS